MPPTTPPVVQILNVQTSEEGESIVDVELLEVIEFDNDRKRMSVLIKITAIPDSQE